MTRIVIHLTTFIVLFIETTFSKDTRAVSHFNEVIVVSQIQLNLVEGAIVNVIIESKTAKE
ncbi:MAG: hypothetical protein ABI371_07595 [Gelidibacter sp.]